MLCRCWFGKIDLTNGTPGEVDSSDKAAWYTVDVDYDKKVVARAEWKVGEAEVSIERVKFVDTADITALPSGTR